MFSGWTSKWPTDRLLTPDEYSSALPRHRQESIEPDDRGAAIAFNSTYVEFVGRRFRLRGGIFTFITTLITIAFIAISVYIPIEVHSRNTGQLAAIIITALFGIGCALLIYYILPRRDFFSRTHYPIRFNRKTREIYVFRDRRDGGIITVPWDEGFFHIGEGLRDKRLLDLRCHVMGQDNVVKDTFVTGMFYSSRQPVEQLWEFIRRYMDEGIDSLADMEIWTTPIPSFANCWHIAGTNLGAINNVVTAVLSPLIFLLAGTRWLVMKTCQKPIWPSDIEAKCTIEPNDPHRLPEPQVIGQFTLERLRAERGKTE